MSGRKRKRRRVVAPDQQLRQLEQRERERREMERLMSSHDTFQRRGGKMHSHRYGFQERDNDDG